MLAFLLHIIALTVITIPVIVAYNLVFGRGKILHFGQVALSIIATYVVWLLVVRSGVSFPLALLAGLAAVSIASFLFAWLSLRLEPDGLGVMSIALHLMLFAVVLNWQSVTRGALGVSGVPRPSFAQDDGTYTLLCIAVAVVFAAFVWWFDRGRFGRQLAALAEHGWHARSLGIRQGYVHVLVFLIAGLGALVTNVLFAPYLGRISPSDYNFPMMIFYLMIVIAGCPGRFWGGVVSVFLLYLLKEGLRFMPLPSSLTGPVELLLFGVILLAAVWWRRDTLFPQQRTV